MNTYDAIIVGAGYAGSVAARALAEKGKKVLILEQRPHIGGNAYDERDEYGVLIHTYGPHIFHTSSEKAYRFLTRFTHFNDYHHEVLANVHGTMIPVPFNLNSLAIAFPAEKAARLREKLISQYGMGSRVPILKLRESADPELQELAEYVYENIFLHYTAKQWEQKPEEVDPSVTARVPVVVSEENGYFQDPWQGMPEGGYTEMFKKMLDHENIDVRLGTPAKDVLQFADGKVLVRDDAAGELQDYDGLVIYTGEIDALFDYVHGALPYRSLRFAFEHYEEDSFQEAAVVNYTVSEDYTRISEFKKFADPAGQGTTIVKEYPQKHQKGLIPYYAILNDENRALYQQYKAIADRYPKLYLLGRLAEYQYYNMDAITARALELVEEIG